MRRSECLIFEGVPRLFEHRGFGEEVEYIGRKRELDSEGRSILAIDAMRIEIDESDPSLFNKNYEENRKRKMLKVQLEDSFLNSNLRKCVSGFYWISKIATRKIATGKL